MTEAPFSLPVKVSDILRARGLTGPLGSDPIYRAIRSKKDLFTQRNGKGSPLEASNPVEMNKVLDVLMRNVADWTKYFANRMDIPYDSPEAEPAYATLARHIHREFGRDVAAEDIRHFWEAIRTIQVGRLVVLPEEPLHAVVAAFANSKRR